LGEKKGTREKMVIQPCYKRVRGDLGRKKQRISIVWAR